MNRPDSYLVSTDDLIWQEVPHILRSPVLH